MRKKKLVYGVGINDANYFTNPNINGKTVKCEYYSVWHHMLERCYSEQKVLESPTYINCIVADEWHSFMNFKSWMESQNWKGKQLDKDILHFGNKVYSPSNCVFVSKKINTLIDNKYKKPFLDVRHNSYVVKVSVNGGRKYLGSFKDEEEADKVYKNFKVSHVDKIANEQKDLRIRLGLKNNIREILHEAA